VQSRSGSSPKVLERLRTFVVDSGERAVALPGGIPSRKPSEIRLFLRRHRCRRLSALRGAYQQFAAKGLVSWETAQDIAAVKSARVQKNSTPSRTQRKAVALREAIPTDSLQGFRDMVLMSVFFLSGRRVSAVIGACVSHLETDGVDGHRRGHPQWASMHEVREFAGGGDTCTTDIYFVRRGEDAAVAAHPDPAGGPQVRVNPATPPRAMRGA
jgi:hypothetical protein